EFFTAKYGFRESSWPMRLLHWEEKLSARFADVVLAPHEACARYYLRSVPREHIVVVMNTPDPRVFSDGPAVRDPDDRTMLYAGTVASRYGVDLAVRALALLRAEVPGLSLRIVGDGDQLPSLRTLARDLDVEDSVHFDGPVPLDRVPAIVRSSWLGVQPNRDDALMRLNLSTKVLEWARLGLPVVVGITPPLAECFTDDEILICEPGDFEGFCARVRQAAKDPDALAAMAERARAASARFSFGDQMAAFVRAIEGSPR
ncbi:MAG TPA: glycosyltransferase family 4 protein, partial [Actinomycetota bacterium]|nr:glycosyltransferase family 4 protein [Actinomycetota bacterium]